MSGSFVTMVFSDLVNSTVVKSKLAGGDVTARNKKYIETILVPHRRRIETNLAAHAGRLVKTEGDAHFLVFPDAGQAAEWAAAIQTSHSADPIETPLGPLQVKIGMHVGCPLQDPHDPEDYIGHEVDYAARVAALAQGGQITLSEAAAALVRANGISGLVIYAHGDRDLKGIGRVPIYELLYGKKQPQPLTQAPLVPSNLPQPPESFIGRADLLAEVGDHLRAGGVTILRGAGGFGKSALALMAAHKACDAGDLPGGVAWINCELNPSRDDCLRQMASVYFGNRMEQEHIDVCHGQVMHHLRDCGALVVLDNFETVDRDVSMLRWLLEIRPPARALITTRQVPPGMRGRIIEVRKMHRTEATALFRERCLASGLQIADDGTDCLNDLCDAVGDQPLAIVLLACRAARLPLSHILERLRRGLTILDAQSDPTRPERHQSIHACFNLSYQQLSSGARDLLMRLSVFPGGVGPELITAAVGTNAWDESAEELVAASFWRLGEARYTVHPLIRQFALEELGSRRADAERQAIIAMTHLVLEKCKHLHPTAADHHAMAAAIEWLATEWQNLLACVAFAAAAQDHAAVCKLAYTTFYFCFMRGYLADAERLHFQARAAAQEIENHAAEGVHAYILGIIYLYQWRGAEAEKACRESIAILQAIGDGLSAGPAVCYLASALHRQGRSGEAEAAFERGLAMLRQAGNQVNEMLALIHFGHFLRDQRRWAEAETAYSQSLGLVRGFSQQLMESVLLNHLAVVHREQQRWTDAERAHQKSLAICAELGDLWRGKLGSQWPGRTLADFARLRAAQGNLPAALQMGREAIVALRQSEDRRSLLEIQAAMSEWERESSQQAGSTETSQ